jgi:uncharacterized protein YjbI with pentapeptide repeats
LEFFFSNTPLTFGRQKRNYSPMRFFVLIFLINLAQTAAFALSRCELGNNIVALKLTDLDLSLCDLGRASWRANEFTNLNLERALAKEMIATAVKIEGSKMISSDFSGAKLDNVTFTKTNLSKAQFRGAHLTRTRFVDCDLTEADFSGARIAQTDFGSSDLSGADFNQVVSFRSSFDRSKQSPSTKLPATEKGRNQTEMAKSPTPGQTAK